MTPGTILRDPTKPFLFLVLHNLLVDPKKRTPVTILSTEPFLLGDTMTQVYTDDNVYYLVPGAGWMHGEHLNTLEPVGTVRDEMCTKCISIDQTIIMQLATMIKAGK